MVQSLIFKMDNWFKQFGLKFYFLILFPQGRKKKEKWNRWVVIPDKEIQGKVRNWWLIV